MAAGKLAAAQQLIKAMAAVNNEAWSAAELTQLYTDASSPARHLAPAVGEGSHIVPLKSSDIKVPGSTPLAGHVLTRLVWVLRGLQERHFTASEELTQQACELVCTLADVLYFIFFPWLSRPSSSRSQQGKATAFGRFLKLGEDAERIMFALADTAKQLNQHVFQRAASVPFQELDSAALCCQRIASLLVEWRNELADAGTSGLEQCYQLVRWCVDSQLLCFLAEGCLLVLGMDPAPYLARGPPGMEELSNVVIMAMNGANHIQGVVLACMGWFEELGDERCDVWLQVGLQGIGSDGTAPAPFLRLMLLYLAICQHWRQSVALPTGSVRNQPRDAKQAAAVRAALQQLLTPSCCSEMVQRVAPAYWAVAITQKFPKDFLILTVPMREDLGAANISQWLRGVSAMAEMYQRGPPCWALGAEELQLIMECAELDAATTDQPFVLWSTLEDALQSCPYPALVEFNTHHARTLLDLAENAVDAALAAAAAAAPNGAGGGTASSSSSRNRSKGEAAGAPLVDVASELAGCLARCLYGGTRCLFTASADSLEAAGYAADATWALLDPSTAPRLLWVCEALLRLPADNPGRYMCAVLPTGLPEMQLFYGDPCTARAVLCAVTSLSKWLQGSVVALAMVLQYPTNAAAAAAATAAAVPGAVGASLAELVSHPDALWFGTLAITGALQDLALQNLVRAALLLDPVSYREAAADVALAAMSDPAGCSSRVWVLEKALLLAGAGLQPAVASNGQGPPHDLPAYKAQLAANTQLIQGMVKHLQPVWMAQQQAAAARQAAQLAKVHGKDAAALTEELQALHLGVGGSSGQSPAAAAAADAMSAQGDAAGNQHGSSAGGSSSALGVAAATADDAEVAANALLVACKAAGALLGAPQLLEQSDEACTGRGLATADPEHLPSCRGLSAKVQDAAEWAVLLHPLLAPLLPAEQGQVLVGLAGGLEGSSSSSSSSSSGVSQQAPDSNLSDDEVAAVLGALQHVVIPGQPGCSNPRCCCMEGVSEAAMKTQVFKACCGARYCSAACQRAHWKAGHKEVCKAVQAAAKAAAEAAVGSGPGQEQDG